MEVYFDIFLNSYSLVHNSFLTYVLGQHSLRPFVETIDFILKFIIFVLTSIVQMTTFLFLFLQKSPYIIGWKHDIEKSLLLRPLFFIESHSLDIVPYIILLMCYSFIVRSYRLIVKS